MNPDPDPVIFAIDLQDDNKKLISFLKVFSAFYFLIKRSHKAVGIKVFLTIFAW
jgi:hypothetical protein